MEFCLISFLGNAFCLNTTVEGQHSANFKIHCTTYFHFYFPFIDTANNASHKVTYIYYNVQQNFKYITRTCIYSQNVKNQYRFMFSNCFFFNENESIKNNVALFYSNNLGESSNQINSRRWHLTSINIFGFTAWIMGRKAGRAKVEH